jgi:hypothetical protein
MKIQEAMASLKPFKRPHSDEVSQWFLGGTGPFQNLVECDYFTHGEVFSTSIDLYASDILADDWVILEDL